jgi:hypothetical protein
MTAPLDPKRLAPATYRRLPAATALLWAERALPRELGWIALGWTLYLIAALFDLGAWMPGQARLALLGLLIVSSTALLLHAAGRVPLPSLGARLARLERGGGLKRGTLALGADSPAGDNDEFGALLWEKAQRQAHAARPRLGMPEWRFSEAVRYGLLPMIGTALLLGVLSAKAEVPGRIARAFSPYAESLEGLRFAVSIEAPGYAALPARRVAVGGGRRAEFEALPGSRVVVRGEGLRGDWWAEAPDGTRYPAGNGTTAFNLDAGGAWKVRWAGRTAATLDVRLADDGTPIIRLAGQIVRTATGALRISYRLLDDHGASALSLRLTRGGKTSTVPLNTSVPSGAGDVFADLTPHAWAGQAVELRLAATDGAGQTGESPAIRVILPQRQFSNALAREIIAVRKQLLSGASRDGVISALSRLSAAPERFDANLAVFAGLRAATWRLHYGAPRARSGTAALLWDIAVDLEDGGASRAMDDLRRAMERLSKEIGSGDDRTLSRLAEDLEKAMSDYLRRQIQAALAAGEPPPQGTGTAPTVDLGFLDQMFADLKARLAAGDKEGAAKALANLRQLMENIRFGGGADPEMAKRARAASEIARGLRDLEGRQGGLRDETIADLIRQQFTSGRDLLKEGAADQRDLGQALGGLRKKFGEAGLPEPAALGEAAKAMAEAEAAMRSGDGGRALRAQTRALDALGKAAGESEAAAERLAGMAGPGAMQPGAAGSGLDPLGRPGTGFGQGAVKLPDQSEVRRIQEIRKILEERASDPSRSAEERGYYLRLLKQF